MCFGRRVLADLGVVGVCFLECLFFVRIGREFFSFRFKIDSSMRNFI